jgi:hypothetical protein
MKCDVRTCNNPATFEIPKQPKFEGAKFCDVHANAVKIISKALNDADEIVPELIPTTTIRNLTESKDGFITVKNN